MPSHKQSKPRRKIDLPQGHSALESWLNAHNIDQPFPKADTKTAVRFTLEELASQYPGNTVEVRVPPYGVIQCMEGPRHTRGTPPNIVELPPDQWLQLVTGLISWDEAKVSASGIRSNLKDIFPLRIDFSQTQ